jgi:hypothetical protein
MIMILIDWMMEVCSDFHFHRDTFHQSIFYVHQYLLLKGNLPLTDLQLLGLASIVIAAKLSEVHIPRLADITKCAADCYTVKQIEDMELSITTTLTWHLTPPTIFFWANLYAGYWDEFSKEGALLEVKFKEISKDSYRRYRLLMQIIDSFSMEIKHLQYNQRVLAASTIYVVLLLEQYSIQDILQLFTKGSKLILESNSFNKDFQSFSKTFLNFSIEELLPGIQYAATFADVPLECDDLMEREEGIGSYEEMLTIQTYSSCLLDYLHSNHSNT